jgi:hypothetical protein
MRRKRDEAKNLLAAGTDLSRRISLLRSAPRPEAKNIRPLTATNYCMYFLGTIVLLVHLDAGPLSVQLGAMGCMF